MSTHAHGPTKLHLRRDWKYSRVPGAKARHKACCGVVALAANASPRRADTTCAQCKRTAYYKAKPA